MGRFEIKSLKAHALASTSFLALAFAPHMAMAQCSPNPTQDTTTTACSGVEPNGVTVSSNSASVNVAAGASVLAPNASSSAVTVNTSNSSSPWWYGPPSIANSGTIDGGGQAGVLVTTSPNTYNPTQVNITVASGGVIQGAHGVVVAGDASNPNPSTAAVTNSGLITGSGGAALYAVNPATGYFTSINNLSGGQIDGVYGNVTTLTNAGVITGGSGSAITSLSRYDGQDQVTNSSGGVIRSSGAAATLSLGGWNSNVANAGVITNLGGGAAINAANGLTLTNAGGVINGDIVAGVSNYGGGSVIDDTGGVINGSIILGAGTNRVIADFGTAANPIVGISGTISPGGGTNTLQLNMASDTTLTSMVVAPTGFQRVSYSVGSGATLTLAPGANPTSTIFVSGNGALVNNANIVTSGAAIAPDSINVSSYGVSVTNNGSITATLSNGGWAIDTNIYGIGQVVNTGTITAIGGGGVNTDGNYALINSGAITADGTAVDAFDSAVTNSGVIHSNHGVGFYGFGNVGMPANNTGTIYGQTIGAELDGYTLTNSGTITSPGMAVATDPYGSLVNLAGGTINGGVGTALYGFTFDTRVENHGTINGSVNLGYDFGYSNNAVINTGVINGDVTVGDQATIDNSGGGVINGSIVLHGSGDRLIADFGGASNPISGVTGTISATGGDEILQLNIAADTTLSGALGGLAPFSEIVFGLRNNATLTFATGANLTAPLYLTGDGSAVNDANIVTTGTAVSNDPADTQATGVNFTNNGTITATLSGGYAVTSGPNGLVAVTNAGAITAIGGGAVNLGPGDSLLNSGTIVADGTAVTLTGGVLTNTGTIRSNQGVGFFGFGSVGSPATNSGTIFGQTAGAELEGYSLTNSGTVSSPGLAVKLDAYGALVNLAGGVVNGEVASPGYNFNDKVDNFGTINGDVNLASASPISATQNVYIAEPGGILNGNLVLGDGADTFVTSLVNTGPGQFAGVTGTVTGIVSPGYFGDTLRYIVTSDATAAIYIPSMFAFSSYDLSGGAKLTLTGTKLQASSIGFSGTGSVDLTADITGTGSSAILDLTQTSMQATGSPATTVPTALNFISHGVLTQTHDSQDGYAAPAVQLNTDSSFTNAGTIVAQDLAPLLWAYPMAAIEGSGTVINTGTINLISAVGVLGATVTNSGVIQQVGGATDSTGILDSGSVVNSGTISTGGAAVVLGAGYSFTAVSTLTNSGSITSANGAGVANTDWGSATVLNQVGGTIVGGTFGVQLTGGSVTNAGIIAGGTDSIIFDGFYNYYSGTNTLTLQTGSTLIGDAVGSANAQNALILQGSGSAINNFLNFTSLDAQGPGIWTLNGRLSIDVTSVTGGTLQIGDANHPTAQLTSAVTVNTGGTLSGHGTIVGNVANNGTVAPGGSIGVLTVNGDYSQSAAGVLSLEVSPTANSSLHITGTATLAGEIQLVTDPGVYRKGQTYRFLTAGTVVGGFTKAVASNGLEVSLSDPAGLLTATFMSSNFAPTGGTANQTAIGAAFANYATGVSDFDPVANAVIALPAGARQNAALDQLGGEVDADLLTTGRASARAVFDSLGEELSEAGRPGGGSASGVTGWGQVIGRYGTIDSGADGAHGLRQTAGGAVAGIQVERGAQTTFGLAFNYQHTDLSLRGLGQSGQFDTAGLALYGEHRWGDLFLDGAASLAWDRGDGARHIAFSGIDRRAEGRFNGYAAGAWTSLGARVTNAYGIKLEPSLSLAFSHVQQGGFTETGAGGADLALGSQAQDSLQAQIGARLSKTLTTSHGQLTLDARLAETGELRNTPPHLRESFAAAAGTAFGAAGADPGRAAGLIGAGFSFAASGRVTLFGHYDETFGDRQTDGVFSLGGKISW